MVRHLPHMHSLKHPSRYPLWNHPGPENLTDLGICHLNLLNFLSFLSCRTRTLLKRCPFCEMNWDPFLIRKRTGSFGLVGSLFLPFLWLWCCLWGLDLGHTPLIHTTFNVSMYFLKTRADIYICNCLTTGSILTKCRKAAPITTLHNSRAYQSHSEMVWTRFNQPIHSILQHFGSMLKRNPNSQADFCSHWGEMPDKKKV